MINEKQIAKLRAHGLIERTRGGEEAVRVTAQNRTPFKNGDYAGLRKAMQEWEKSITATLVKHGADVVPGSLSVLGQTIELLVPAKDVVSINREFAKEEVRLDLMEDWNAELDE